MIKASSTVQTGNIGELAIGYQFTKLNWHVAPNPAGEVGTDVFLQPRTATGIDSGALIAGQVKNGDTWFDYPEFDADGKLVGWWFRDTNSEHLKYWLEYSVPFILFLHEESTEKSYWVHVTQDSVKSTGKGAKILVRVDSTVDKHHIGDLLEIATKGRIHSQWEGTAWGSADVLSTDRYRYAMLTPRLVAPHPNSPVTKLEPHEAIALLIKMRLRHLTPRTAVDALAKSTKDPAPDLAECRSSTTWGWRFYAAAHDILGGDANIDALEKLVKDAKAPSERAAAAVFACALSVEDGNPQGGLDVVDGALTHSDYSDVDRAWLLLHRGRCLAELGDLANARLCAVDVQKIRNVAVDDPTAMAITGSGTDLIFRLNPWSTDSKEVIGVEEVIKGRDTLASWWSRQEVADGLEIQFTDQFQVWVGNSEGPELDPTSLRLRSATLLAGIAADHSSWRRSHTLLAQYTLMNDSSAEEIAKSLAALRHAGEHKLIEDTVRHLLRVGPATAVRAAAGVVRLELGTRTSLHADLQTISSASDVLETDWADTHARWILARLNDTGDLATRLQPTFSLEHALLKVLSNLVSVISAPVLREVIEHIKESPQQGDIGSSYDWARVVENVPISEWTSDDRTAVAVRSKDGPVLKEAFDRILAKHDSAHRETIQKRIEEGNLSALSAFGDVRDLDDDIAKGVIEKLSSATTQRISDLKSGSFAMGVKDFASDLVTLNVWYPQLASWDSISDLLTTELPFVSDRQGVLAVRGTDVSYAMPAVSGGRSSSAC